MQLPLVYILFYIMAVFVTKLYLLTFSTNSFNNAYSIFCYDRYVIQQIIKVSENVFDLINIYLIFSSFPRPEPVPSASARTKLPFSFTPNFHFVFIFDLFSLYKLVLAKAASLLIFWK